MVEGVPGLTKEVKETLSYNLFDDYLRVKYLQWKDKRERSFRENYPNLSDDEIRGFLEKNEENDVETLIAMFEKKKGGR